ncbi:MAG TPA: hypothetical protein VE053_04730 [Allosphingosinicella sp.]|nr:hypothetical protein [Allosphingosinicella sp.]
MTTEEAYDIICDDIERDRTKKSVSRFFDSENFGNFIVRFKDKAGIGSVICDRRQIDVCDDEEGSKNCRPVVSLFDDVTKDSLLEALNRAVGTRK